MHSIVNSESASTASRSRAAAGRLARRRPARMPSGIVDDSVAGAEHLVSRPGAVLLVDGYNATLSSWPELSLEHQRDRLLALVNDLTARIVGLEAHLIFDGSDHVITPGRRRRSVVHVRFSPADVEADDVVLAMVDELPVGPGGDRGVERSAGA